MVKKKIGFRTILIVMILTLVIAGLWDSLPLIRDLVHSILDPSFGTLLNWNLYLGMIIIVIFISFLTTLIQKYTTDQEALKELKEKQKRIQEEIKKFQKEGNSAKTMELQKKQFEAIPETFRLSMSSFVYTGVPFILFIRWFQDFFASAGEIRFLGFLNWFWFYLILLVLIGGILRKVLKVH